MKEKYKIHEYVRDERDSEDRDGGGYNVCHFLHDIISIPYQGPRSLHALS